MKGVIEQVAPALRGVAEPQTTQNDAARKVAGRGVPTEARVEFSSFVLQGFLEAGLPKDLVGSAGSGTAGTMWRSMLIGELSKVLARTGELDLLAGSQAATQADGGQTAVKNSGTQIAPGPADGGARSNWETKVTGT